MQKLTDPQFLQEIFLAAKDWLFSEVLVLSSLGQIVVIVGAFVLAWALRSHAENLLRKLNRWKGVDSLISKVADTLSLVTLPFLWLVIQYISGLVAAFAEWPHHLITVTVSLLTAWIIIGMTTVLIRDKTWSKTVTIVA